MTNPKWGKNKKQQQRSWILNPSSHFRKVVHHFNSAVQKLKHYLSLHSTRCKITVDYFTKPMPSGENCVSNHSVSEAVNKITQWSWTNMNKYWLPSQQYGGRSKKRCMFECPDLNSLSHLAFNKCVFGCCALKFAALNDWNQLQKTLKLDNCITVSAFIDSDTHIFTTSS